ncbi:MAG: cupin domain-containing protein [Candidatus Pacebacteria bacterium]|jgi:mannose-6-phosphate isomerase-like protein (cupin superfamily)|nr:cupin domain-containing protein [Candidatus Paceibacterota bacterium]
MKIIRKNQAKFFKNSEVCDVFEYDSGHTDLGGAVVEVRGRYPDSGWVMNSECREMAYILKGKGLISVEGVERDFAAGNLILIEAGEKYFWEGNFSAFLFSVPAWSVGQYKTVD